MNLIDEFNKAMTYKVYVDELGEYLSLHQLHYKKFSIDHKLIARIKQFKPLKILVLTEAWCGDSLALLPMMRKIAEFNNSWQMKVLSRDSNPALIEQFLTNGVRAIPVFLFLDVHGDFLFRWGPRPKATAEIFDAHRSLIKQGRIEKQDVIKKIRTYYAKDRGEATLRELLAFFENNKLE